MRKLICLLLILTALLLPAEAGAVRTPLTLMIVVDRSGSVQRAHSAEMIQRALIVLLNASAEGKPVFDETLDVVGLGSFAGTWKLDFAPASNFRSGLTQAIGKIPFESGATNTSEALYRAYKELLTLNRVQSRSVILLVTDGRPSAFTATFGPNAECGWESPRTGYVAATVQTSWPPLPPATQGEKGTYTFGLFRPDWTVFDMVFIEGGECHYYTDRGQPFPGTSFHKDFPEFPAADAYGNSTVGPVYPLMGRSMSNPQAVRFASFNAADNVATTIRTDRVLHPALFVVGLHQLLAEESIDAEWLVRVANDVRYPFRSGETPGRYFDVQFANGGIEDQFKKIAEYIASLTALPLQPASKRK